MNDRKTRWFLIASALLGLSFVASGCGNDGGGRGASSGDGTQKGTLTIGSDSFAEAQIVAEMYAQVLEDAGYEVRTRLNLDSREIRLPAMESGDIDIAPEYLASLLSVIDPDVEVAQQVDEVARQLDPRLEKMGLELLEPSDVVDTNAFVTTQEIATEHGLRHVSDLEAVAGDFTLGAPPECPERPFCIPGLKRVYGVEFGDFKALEYGATITALAEGAIDIGLLFSTDGSIAANDFVLLEDDKNLQAADNITPLVRSEVLNDEVRGLLDRVTAALDTASITELNRRANVDVEDPADLAREFLEEKELL